MPFEVKPEDFTTAFLGLRALGVKGVNITLPFKEKALELCEFVDEHARHIGAVNTIKFADRIEGYNTDWIGFLKALKNLEGDIKNKKVLVLGAGGTSKAVIYALNMEGCYVYVWNRTNQKALELAERFSIHVVGSPEDVLDDVDIIVNTTSVGLSEKDPQLFDYEKIKESHTVFDVIYRRTPLLEKALEKGAKAQDGLAMLLYQGIESFRIWTNMEVPFRVVKDSLSL
ncbi:MAG: shikimate dehydrogenase [Hydrogenobacter sp.]